jgi:hypothetical protein
MRNIQTGMRVGLLTLALCCVVCSRVWAQPAQPKQAQPTPPVPNKGKVTYGWDIEKDVKPGAARVEPTPRGGSGRNQD